MYYSKPPQQRFDQLWAAAHDGVLVNIDDNSHDNEELCCVYCNCKMIRVRGEIRSWHYRHNYKSIREQDVSCSFDLYLQALARKFVMDWYEKSESVTLNYIQKNVCSKYNACKWNALSASCFIEEKKAFDIKKALPQISFQELVRTTSKSSHSVFKLYNESDDQKYINLIISTFEREEQVQMPEGRTIVVQIENEQDLARLTDGREIAQSREISLYHFDLEKNNDTHNGSVSLSRYLLYGSGKFFGPQQVKCTDSIASSVDMAIACLPNEKSSFIYNWLIASASQAPYRQHYCSMCRNRYLQNRCLYCVKTGEQVNFKHPHSECRDYDPDVYFIQKELSELKVNESNPFMDVYRKSK